MKGKEQYVVINSADSKANPLTLTAPAQLSRSFSTERDKVDTLATVLEMWKANKLQLAHYLAIKWNQ